MKEPTSAIYIEKRHSLLFLIDRVLQVVIGAGMLKRGSIRPSGFQTPKNRINLPINSMNQIWVTEGERVSLFYIERRQTLSL